MHYRFIFSFLVSWIASYYVIVAWQVHNTLPATTRCFSQRRIRKIFGSSKLFHGSTTSSRSSSTSSDNDEENNRNDNNNKETAQVVSIDEFATSIEQLQQNIPLSESILHAAASITRESCQLLGVKSLGVDYGLVRTGVAVTVGYEPKPLAIVSGYNSTQEVAQQVIQYCAAEGASQIIVGLPLHKNGTEAEQTNITRIFAHDLAKVVMERFGPNMPVYMFDERYTSKEAAARAHSLDPNQYLYGTLDAAAACIILEHFYQDNGKGKQLVELSPPEVKEHHYQKWKRRQEEQKQKNQQTNNSEDSSPFNKRKAAMERAKRLEEELAKSGELGMSQKKKKKIKKKRAKRGPWIVPGSTATSNNNEPKSSSEATSSSFDSSFVLK